MRITPEKCECEHEAHTEIYTHIYTPTTTYTNPAQMLHRNTLPLRLEGAYF